MFESCRAHSHEGSARLTCPCERGHGGTEIGNKHCGPDLAILKEQSQFPEGSPNANFTHDPSNGILDLDWYYRVTVGNFSNTSFMLTGGDPLCDTGVDVFEAPGEFSLPEPLGPGRNRRVLLRDRRDRRCGHCLRQHPR
jgi:hypothetical protein